MDISALEEIGMTNAEIKIYVVLLELGSSTAGPILEKTGLQNSVVHLTLHKLVDKGFVSFIKKGKVKHYQAADPQWIVNYIEEKKKNIEALLPILVSKQHKAEKQEAEIFEGFQGFKTMLWEFIKDGKKGDEYLFFSFYTKDSDEFDNVFKFYAEFEKERKKRGILIKGIIPISIKDKFRGRDMKNLLFVNYPVPTNISVLNDKIIFTPWEDQKVSFLVHSRQLAESFRQYFWSIWNNDKSKKLV